VNNTFYRNTVINNDKNVESSSSVNFWDNGEEGNYWSDYNGTDSNGDGIGDIPYIIDENNRDNFPLMKQTIPEFLSWTILPLVLAVALFSVVVKRKLYGQSFQNNP